MILDQTDCPTMQLLVNRTRLAHVTGPDLAAAHRDVGQALAPFAGRRILPLAVDIDHVAGPSKGVALSGSQAPILLVLMRAGLFVAEGLWRALPGAALEPWDGKPESLEGVPITGRPVIVVDSVINSGRSMDQALEAVTEHSPAWVSVACLVANIDGLKEREKRWPLVEFAVARVSHRSYVGRGKTNTGARLFGTTSWD